MVEQQEREAREAAAKAQPQRASTELEKEDAEISRRPAEADAGRKVPQSETAQRAAMASETGT